MFFFHKERNVGDKKIPVSYEDLKITVQAYSKQHDHGVDHGRLTWFGTLLGWVSMEVHEDIITAYHPDASKIYLYMLHELIGEQHIKVELSHLDVYISYEKAEIAVRETFKRLYSNKESHMKNAEKIIAKLEGRSVKKRALAQRDIRGERKTKKRARK